MRRLTCRTSVLCVPHSDTLLASVRILFLAGLLHSQVAYLHRLLKSILLEPTMRYSKDGVVFRMVLE
jgi:hypothetical protein